ncbi:hypothetical protein ACIRPK_09530 [Kitasatospora sp. NPDC101801]|uniref:hypothetical protein n=1 Tax=Kitasatospora sp. NPDC101801 TaxID=3364103 RepID=UPI0038302921
MPDSVEHLSDYADVMVLIEHPAGDVACPLARWIKLGPGPRPYLRPSRAWSASTGEELPLTLIPFRYRNTRAARQAIRDGRIPDPWPGAWSPPSQQEEDGRSPHGDPYEDAL